MTFNFEYKNASLACGIIKKALKDESLETIERMTEIVEALKQLSQKNKSKKNYFSAMENIYFNFEDCNSEEELDNLIYTEIKRFFK